jgi:hypothetical protein
LLSRYHKFVGYAFVDDTDIIQSTLCNDDQQVINKLQEAVDLWEHAIVPEKAAWWLVSFRWSGMGGGDMPQLTTSQATSTRMIYQENIRNYAGLNPTKRTKH